MQVGLTINGQERTFDAPADRTLGELLRRDASLPALKLACAEGTCGACTVMLDDRPVLSCLTLAAACNGSEVRTLEGGGHLLEQMQAAFTEHDAFQCGFCTPGQLMSAVALLERDPAPTRDTVRRHMSGNLCRCGAYPNIEAAVLAVAEANA
jgi:aerobic-type carbon monoxide dehydrogenase small subunit (CoxS/CutS family)